ncbi:hypothetical protein [Methanoculleus sp. 10]|nr:hypothetical protein [Methanoculleus sp. 10]MBP7410625.1 hypothetical protein [Methanoculleus sp.]
MGVRATGPGALFSAGRHAALRRYAMKVVFSVHGYEAGTGARPFLVRP